MDVQAEKVESAVATSGFLGSVLIGVSFAAGWTPCVGPILASVLVIAATQPGSGLVLMLVYALGFAVPFFILAYTLGSVHWIAKYANVSSKIGGWLLVVMGVLLLTDWIQQVTA